MHTPSCGIQFFQAIFNCYVHVDVPLTEKNHPTFKILVDELCMLKSDLLFLLSSISIVIFLID